MHHRLTRLSCVVLFATAALAQTPQLFLPAAPGPVRESVADNSAIRIPRSRQVQVNPSAIEENVESISLNLFNDAVFEAKRFRSYWTRDESAWVWHGKIEGMKYGQIVLVWTGADLVSASIHTDDGRFFRIRPTDEAHYLEQVEMVAAAAVDDAIRVTAEDLAKEEEKEFAVSGVRKTGFRGPVARSAATTQIDILVAYTERVRSLLGTNGAIAKINQALADANAANANSNVQLFFNLAGTMVVAFDDSLGVQDALSKLHSQSDGYLDEVPLMRNTLGADLASLWIDGPASGGGTVGVAYMMTTLSTGFASHGYSVVEQNFGPAPRMTFAHEIGHNMGSEHDRANAAGQGITAYSYGLQQTTTPPSFSTVMAYDNCAGGCPRIPYWSNPLVNYQNIPTGIAQSNPAAADNASSLNLAKDTVAAFRTSTAGCDYLLTPASVSVSSNAGGGSVTVTATTGCAWYSSTAADWLFIVSGSNGSGNGTVGYSYTPNTTQSSRSGVITIGGQTFTVNQNASPGTVPITVGTSPATLQFSADGTTYSSAQTFNWAPGSTHAISAVTQGTNPRYLFSSWSDGGSSSHTYTVPSASETVTAIFTAQYPLTTAVAPANSGSIAIAPGSADGYYNSGTQVTLQASAASGYTFTAWSGSSGATTATIGVTMNAAKSLTANFVQTTVPVTFVTSPPGLIVTVDGTNAITPAAFQWTPGSTHVIAVATQGSAPRYRFGSWSDGGAASHTYTTPAGATTVTAVLVAQHLLTTSVSPAGTGSVSANPAAADNYYDNGTVITLTPAAANGYLFASWSGAASGSASPLAVTMNAAKNITANFVVGTSAMTITSNPVGMSVTVDGINYVTPRSFTWNIGTSHTIATATQGTGTRYVFQSWSDGQAASHGINTPATSTTITANFATQYLLTVGLSDPTAGSVTRNPQATDGYYNAGSQVQLTAQAAALHQFSSWSGAASGVQNPLVVLMDGPKTVTANFNTLAPCTYLLTTADASVASPGDIRTVKVSTDANCAWTAKSNVPWLVILSGFGATGSGVVRISIAPNSNATARTGTLTIAGLAYTVMQTAGTCTFTVTGPAATLPSAGASYSIAVSTQAGCEWSAITTGGWISLSGATAGTGSGSVNFAATANFSTSPRIGHITVAGQWLPLLQKPVQATTQFTDIPASDSFFDYVNFLSLNQITNGCASPTLYCPGDTMTRAEMAAFVIRALYGENFSFTRTPYFTDVPSTHSRFSYVQKMRDLGITTGCGTGLYCPDGPLTREQMAVFIVRARLGITSTETFPFPSAQFFSDVPGTNGYFSYIQKLKELGITTGCSATAYCGTDPNTRGQMAVFVARGLF
ncbi:MAG: S-layer homology domain-containing protein [Acidobacteria bacterium]|nr:S-layer homology domain-containing protein [Acidobacteriota bacterium]